jgi:hypothetical protein
VYNTNFRLGSAPTIIPDYINKKKHLKKFITHRKSGKPIKDNLCLFRCLAHHLNNNDQSLEKLTKRYFKLWQNSMHLNTNVKSFKGVLFSDLQQIEDLFETNINIFELTPQNSVLSIWKSKTNYDSVMNLNHFDNHLMVITNMNSFAPRYQCRNCEKMFKNLFSCKRHEKTCSFATKFKLKGGTFTITDDIFDKLSHFGIHVDKDLQNYPYYAVYDFEALLKSTPTSVTDNLIWTHTHIPMSVSLCSNIEGHTNPVCFVNENEHDLIEDMLTGLNNIRNDVIKLTTHRWGNVFEQLDNQISEFDALVNQSDESDPSNILKFCKKC